MDSNLLRHSSIPRLAPDGASPPASLSEPPSQAAGNCRNPALDCRTCPPSSPAWSANIAFRGSFWPSASCVAPIIAEFGELDPMSPELTSAIRLRRITVRCQDGETLRIKI